MRNFNKRENTRVDVVSFFSLAKMYETKKIDV